MLQTTWTNIKESCGIKKSLTQMFLDDFKQVMRSYVIGVPGSLISPLPPGDGKFRLEEITQTGALLKKSINESPFIQGYYVHSEPNNNNSYTLFNGNREPYYMFTVPLTGCQVIVYSFLIDKNRVFVEHNNYISDPNPDQSYAEHLKKIKDKKPDYLFSIRASDVNNIINGGTYDIHAGIVIVGRYETGQWKFYIRDNINVRTLPTIHGPF